MFQSIEEFNRKYHISLNPQQQAAQSKIDGRFLILAVPGSGKTTVLVDRLGYMVLAGGVDPASILTVTYTRAAAGEMQKRFADKFDDGALHYSEAINFCTINSFAHQVLRFYGGQIGKKQFDIVSDEDVHSIIRDIFLKNEKTYPTESDFKDITT
ncbi:MAG: ATP-dependent helicase, partial [Lachnospiraceae bacterium]|nr:ATP-dependent helicase [Lachnospiraceae bacterium]